MNHFFSLLATVLVAVCIALPVRAAPAETTEPAKDETDQKIEALTAQAYQTVEDARLMLERAKEKFKELSADPHTKKALDEVEKMFRLEYKVIEFEKEEKTTILEQQLENLGSERWDCSSLSDSGSKTRLLCKRHPQSYLQYLQKLL